MAEFVVGTVVEKLTNILVEEAAYLDGVSGKVQRLRNELKWMQSFLKDADAKQASDVLVCNWVSEIRDLAYDAEEVIDSFISKAASHRKRDRITKPLNLYKVGRKIASIRVRIEEISSRRETYGVVSISGEGGEGSGANERLKWWRQPSPLIEEDDIIELVEDAQVLVEQLTSLEYRRSVVSIVGMGGLGKTTLAKKLYNHNDVKYHFDCKAWVYVSKDYRRREILQGIIMDANALDKDEMQNLERMKEEDLVKELYEFLEERRYLVVLDDIWSPEAWDSIKAAFPHGKSGSKVLITTRNKGVALHAGPGQKPHEPRILTEEESLELLCRKAFPGTKSLPVELEKLGREIAVKCGGLPLALIVLGGLLSRQNGSSEEWRRVLHNISWHLVRGEDRTAAILALSYNDLPLHLKSCFLYLGLFPEDVSIKRKHLVRLWVAEGFLPQEGEATAESVAEKCLNELIQRCMIQAGRINWLGSVKTIGIHDLLRDLAISNGREENFLEIHHRNKVHASTSRFDKSRRHAIHSCYDQYTFLECYAPSSRSLIFFNGEQNAKTVINNRKILLGHTWNFLAEKKLIFYKNFKRLRVLSLDGVRNLSLPSTIGDFIQLRYLGLRKNNLEQLPPSIGNLQHLQTLDLRYSCFLKRIPNVIWKMVDLRHLLLYTPFDSPDSGHLRMDTLTNLQSLPYIEAGNWIAEGGLAGMINLRQLGIGELSREKVSLVILTIARLHHLQSLSLMLQSQEEAFPSCMQFSHYDHLIKLCFYGKMEAVPSPRQFPPNLMKLTLYYSHLQKDSIALLERLPSLKMLILGKRSYVSRELTLTSDGFPSLETLRLHFLEELEEWIVEERSIPRLKQLVINSCEKLERIPQGLKLVTTLKELKIVGMPILFEYRLRKDLLEFKQAPVIRSTTTDLLLANGVSAASAMLGMEDTSNQ